MDGFIGIGAAAKALGVSISTLRRWEREGRIQAEYTKGGHRRYNLSGLVPEQSFRVPDDRKTIAYARVSSSDQKDDLERPQKVLELYCAQSSKMCSDCGYVLPELSLGVRQWQCPECGAEHHRDINAALNLRNLALTATGT